MTLSSMSGDALPVLMLVKFRFTDAMHLSILSICISPNVATRTRVSAGGIVNTSLAYQCQPVCRYWRSRPRNQTHRGKEAHVCHLEAVAFTTKEQNASWRAYCVFFNLVPIFKSQDHNTAVPRSVHTAYVSVTLHREHQGQEAVRGHVCARCRSQQAGQQSSLEAPIHPPP